MAGSPDLFRYNEDRVAVAVIADFPDILEMTGTLPLIPELLPAAAEEPGAACPEGEPQGLLVHIAQHENLSAVFILDYGRYQAPVIKSDLFYNFFIYFFHCY